MNNSQFRKLVLNSTPARQNNNGESTPAPPKPAASALGTKKSRFVPMTPRNAKGGTDVDFARQVRERNAALQATKKFKASAPKGAKFGAGYTDRAKAREAEEEKGENSKAARSR
jgi:hypothetical protein